MAVRIAKTRAQDCLNDIVDSLDLSGGGDLKIYTGSQPSNPDALPAGTLLATLALSNPAFPGASQTSNGATLSANAITAAEAVASGTAGCFQLVDGSGTPWVNGDVGATSSGAELELDDTSITAGQLVTVSSLTLTI